MRASGRMILGMVALLGACSSETKLFDRSLPDETKVIDGPSLAVPPDMELRPPREAQDYESVLREQKTAEGQALITGVSTTTVVGGSSTVPGDDEWLLKQTGTKADPNVREQMAKDIAEPEEEKKKDGLFDRWFKKNKDEN